MPAFYEYMYIPQGDSFTSPIAYLPAAILAKTPLFRVFSYSRVLVHALIQYFLRQVFPQTVVFFFIFFVFSLAANVPNPSMMCLLVWDLNPRLVMF